MRKISCPYCYRRTRAGQLHYQCNGRGSVGRAGCKADTSDPDRVRETGYTQPVRRSYPPLRSWWRSPRQAPCPSCGSLSGIRVCPHCHTPLPVSFGTSNSPLIAMIGAKGTGKSVYLTVLANELRVGLRRRFQSAVRLTGDAQGGFSSPQQWLDNNVKLVYENHALPPQTAAATGGRREPLVFEWRQPRTLYGFLKRIATTYLSFYDTAGEDLSSLRSAQDLAYLDAADALILLLDPFMLPQARDRISVPTQAITEEPTIQILGQVTEALRTSRHIPGSKRIKIPVAVAFAKIDAFFDILDPDDPLLRPPVAAGGVYDETAGRATHEHVRALLDDWGGDDIDSYLQTNYTTFRYFVVSSLGAPPDYANAKVDAGGVRPYRVDEPLVWLLSRFGVVPSRETR
ncbi:hypothetical protein F4553_006407 [Allocatelliglobosispora scoriae]|uniref:Uncharacterized protein n=1 Tax=Allocatelliglobosispora scoriae TaxID=643052 RepID=A0A841C1F4_9ACTN|nr:hypothetical protein [Allocatelliglobosispora scoriae]MBB5872973.1 hypothetical protein [Allocatelliglobosispora scoriae]